MVPYIHIPPLVLGSGITIQPFGLLVVAGCIAGFFAARWYAGSLGLERSHFVPLVGWTLIPAFVLAHWFAIALYFPEVLVRDPAILAKIGTSMSSYGGFLGASAGAILYLRKYKLPIPAYFDALMFGTTVGWLFGRFGCTIIHDHPGIHSDFFLAVQYPDGPRHDLGFYEWLFTIGLVGILLLIHRKRLLPPGGITGFVCIVYTPVRFLLDFLRATDKLYFGLTPGQYFSILLFPVGIVVLVYAFRANRQSESGTKGLQTLPPD